jgi:hypothetical protein
VSLKRLRYGIEFLLPLLPEKATVRFANDIAEIQETLGYLNDEAVARSRLKAWAGKDPELRSGAAFVAGWHAPKIARLRRNVLTALEPILWGKSPVAALIDSSAGNMPAQTPGLTRRTRRRKTMDLLLWRHAEAVEGLPDNTRELTERGVRQAHKVAEWLESRRPKKLRVLVSPTTRTRQTASAFTKDFEDRSRTGPRKRHRRHPRRLRLARRRRLGPGRRPSARTRPPRLPAPLRPGSRLDHQERRPVVVLQPRPRRRNPDRAARGDAGRSGLIDSRPSQVDKRVKKAIRRWLPTFCKHRLQAVFRFRAASGQTTAP